MWELRRLYHYFLAALAAVIYRFPSEKIKVIAVTGTKGKSSTTEILNAILEEAGYKTALSNTIRFKVGPDSRENLYKMSMPGRFFAQRFIRQAVNASCDFVIMEMTSQGALLHRHKFIDLDALVFTNLSPEHIEAHGSYEKYRDAKLALAQGLINCKKDRFIIVNGDDPESEKFLAVNVTHKIKFSINDGPKYNLKLQGEFNQSNVLAAAAAAKAYSVSDEVIKRSVEKFDGIPGRVQKIRIGDTQKFDVIVDYAHTPDSLRKVYEIFKGQRIIGVLGGTGGGRDNWKRKELGKIADEYCDKIILTDEDPYDEDPRKIVDDVAAGISKHKPEIIMDRREAINRALQLAMPGDAVVITGKGTDPYIMGPKGSKIAWSDAKVAFEELQKLHSADLKS